ncbi:GNAT family N-acetyltransferase [Chitinimonas viridis]|uniref:GNAT family N-acetyltransferase n=1 Tax=Chitinimonas viridis TaxID=664880 RepID=A0ABT8B480_9NEIS|nr:GNAT family N-acetyltransferase [Chitinimonas viridis]MDN3576918.1 GNAT family N-acetyltransferase [Chitinimonas viridis]
MNGLLQLTQAAALLPHLPDNAMAAFARYIVECDPGSTAMLADDGSAWVLGGPWAGRPEVPSYWAYAQDQAALDAALHWLDQHAPVADVALCNLPADELAIASGWQIGWDTHLCLDGPGPGPTASAIPIVNFEQARQQGTPMHPELAAQGYADYPALMRDFGRLDRFFGAIHEGQLVAMAECNLAAGSHISIQAVSTASTLRNRGLGKAVVGHAANWIHAQGKQAHYLASTDNHASIALARACGFNQAMTLPYLYRPTQTPSPS